MTLESISPGLLISPRADSTVTMLARLLSMQVMPSSEGPPLSRSFMVASEGSPFCTIAGSAPKFTITVSPSSLSSSGSAKNVNLFSVSPLSKVSMDGMPE